MNERKYQRKWVRIVDPKLQFHTLKVGGLFSLALAVILVSIVQGIESKILGTAPRAEDVRRAVAWLYYANAFFIVATGILIGLYAIVHSHRIAGPAYRLARVSRQMASGDLREPVRVRRGDYLVDLAAALEGLRTRLTGEESERRVSARRLREAARSVQDLEARAELEGIAARWDPPPPPGATGA